MKIAFLIPILLGLSAVASSHWEEFLLMFKHQSVVTRDCGGDWQFFDFNESVPSNQGGNCFKVERLPKEPLPGNKISFVGRLGTNVEMSIAISYYYEIFDPEVYMAAFEDAPRHTSWRVSIEGEPSVWESAKWLFIDSVVQEVASSPEILQNARTEDTILEVSESQVVSTANSRLAPLGIRLTEVRIS